MKAEEGKWGDDFMEWFLCPPADNEESFHDIIVWNDFSGFGDQTEQHGKRSLFCISLFLEEQK